MCVLLPFWQFIKCQKVLLLVISLAPTICIHREVLREVPFTILQTLKAPKTSYEKPKYETETKTDAWMDPIESFTLDPTKRNPNAVQCRSNVCRCPLYEWLKGHWIKFIWKRSTQSQTKVFASVSLSFIALLVSKCMCVHMRMWVCESVCNSAVVVENCRALAFWVFYLVACVCVCVDEYLDILRFFHLL